MCPDNTYIRKISISILKYSITQGLLCIAVFIVLTSLTYWDGLSKEEWRELLSLVMYGFCSNKALYSASLSFTMFIGPAAVARRVLQNRVCSYFPLCGCFLGNNEKMNQDWAKNRGF